MASSVGSPWPICCSPRTLTTEAMQTRYTHASPGNPLLMTLPRSSAADSYERNRR